MSKSFCAGCKHWHRIIGEMGYVKSGFHFCDKFQAWELNTRKQLCNGRLKEELSKKNNGGMNYDNS